jgi:hypothetical protein
MNMKMKIIIKYLISSNSRKKRRTFALKSLNKSLKMLLKNREVKKTTGIAIMIFRLNQSRLEMGILMIKIKN